MKTNRLVALLLLLALSVSIVHEYAIAWHDSAHDHCSVTSYIAEFSQPDLHAHDADALCSGHYIYHIACIITEPLRLYPDRRVDMAPYSLSSIYPRQIPFTSIKPPIRHS